MKKVEPDYRRISTSRDACAHEYPNTANTVQKRTVIINPSLVLKSSFLFELDIYKINPQRKVTRRV